MSNLSKSPVFDAAKNRPREWVEKVGVHRVKQKAPNGQVERWVDEQGNVVFVQMLQPAALIRTPAVVDAKRAELGRRGWIAHARCPLSSGAMTPGDFADDLRAYCEQGTYGPGRACKHVEYVIKVRQAEQAEKMRLQDEVFFAEKNERQRIEREKIAATDRLNDRLAQVLERAVGGGAAADPEPPPAAPAPSRRGKDAG